MNPILRDRINFFIKRPTERGRRSFSILRKTKKPNGQIIYEKVKLQEIDAINLLLRSGTQDLATCEKQIREIIDRLNKEEKDRLPAPLRHKDNLNILDEYWKKEYSHRELVDRKTIYNDLRRAIEALGNHSLVSATREELQKAINSRFSGNGQRRIASKINQLLKYIGRSDVRLRKDKKVYRDVRYLTLTEFERVASFIPNPPFQILCYVGFATGMRIGEIFAIRTHAQGTRAINVVAQIDKNGERRKTKNRLNRLAYLLPEGRKWVQEWLNLDSEEKERLRYARHSDLIATACRKAFPQTPAKWCVFHDLRHSYAVHLLAQGVSLSLVAQSLGNHITVCQEYYAGFALTNDSIEAIDSVLERA